VKELITESQADLIVALLSVGVFIVPLGLAFYRNRKVAKNQQKMLWAYAGLCALVGPVIWIYWQVFNSIENYYGLDSLKALEINFFIVVGMAALFVAAHFLLTRNLQQPKALRRRK
jgi:hypothetical protein